MCAFLALSERLFESVVDQTYGLLRGLAIGFEHLTIARPVRIIARIPLMIAGGTYAQAPMTSWCSGGIDVLLPVLPPAAPRKPHWGQFGWFLSRFESYHHRTLHDRRRKFHATAAWTASQPDFRAADDADAPRRRTHIYPLSKKKMTRDQLPLSSSQKSRKIR
jgi:hypothetical protein